MNNKKIFLFSAFAMLFSNALFAQQTSYKFDFGTGKTAKGYINILPGSRFEDGKKYGFDFNSKVEGTEHAGKNVLTSDGVKSEKPFYFSAAVPEGNYEVTVTLGDEKEATSTTVKAESRRLMLENIKTKAGQFLTKTFIVNIKDRNITGGQVVSLKPRELTKLDWDDKLTLEFDGKTVLAALEIKKVENQITVFLAGNSTVVNQEEEPWASWGQMIPRFFKPGVAIANHAESGLTLGSFLGSKRLTKVLSVMKPGDYLFVEFGHNDQKDKGPNDGAYKSYTERLKTFITETRKKGGIPVIVTSTSRRSFDSTGKIQNTLGDFPDAARKVAKEENIALIDLNVMTAQLFNALGEEQSKKALVHYPANSYPGQDKPLADNTHFNPYGAYEIAQCVILGIKNQKLGLIKYLVDDLPVFDPSEPDDLSVWKWPESPGSSLVKPDGN
ncbi:rhamnogalacturonan acetylesterase [Pedobacter petrophilus]|uniref:Rhamnogalacturonan acetylesterase n=1 Tax=Pedobacter petrophilus TaxID=1908241 RepID=A0A7K0FWJ9_9SPHI|nr:GDSL-type esterase/lipase family protein [Pedobacter petrophilus]MRX75116.1 rhamnogalacturonan acetylesterase [Pedobacter petrophilus]